MSWARKFRLKWLERMVSAKTRTQKATMKKRGKLKCGRETVSVVVCSSRTGKGTEE